MFAFTHRLVCFVFFVYTSLFLVSCTSEEKRKKVETPTVGIVIYDANDSFITTIRRSIQKNLPNNVISLFVDSKSDPFLQTQQVTKLVKEGVSVLVLNPIDVQRVAPLVELARKKSIPLIFFNGEPSRDVLNLYDRTCYVGSTPSSAGTLQAEAIYKYWQSHPEISKKNKDKKVHFVMLQGSPSSVAATIRTEYAIKHAKELGVPLEQVGQTYFCQWKRPLAKQAIRSAISEGVQYIDIIIANSDPMALGAMDALEEIGYNLKNGDPNKYIPIFGIDANPEALEALRQKRITATVKRDGDEIGRVIAKAVENALARKSFIEGTGYQWDDSGKLIHIPCTYQDSLN